METETAMERMVIPVVQQLLRHRQPNMAHPRTEMAMEEMETATVILVVHPLQYHQVNTGRQLVTIQPFFFKNIFIHIIP